MTKKNASRLLERITTTATCMSAVVKLLMSLVNLYHSTH
jgi:hypothetical protein